MDTNNKEMTVGRVLKLFIADYLRTERSDNLEIVVNVLSNSMKQVIRDNHGINYPIHRLRIDARKRILNKLRAIDEIINRISETEA